MLLFCARSFGQYVMQQQESTISFSFGVSRPFIDNQAFDNWRLQNYNIKAGHLGGNFDITGIARNNDFGIHISSAPDFNVASVYFGRRLTNMQSSISSFLNFQAGAFWATYSNIAPLDVTVPPDNQGDKPQLEYSNFYFALSSKNYFNKLNINLGKSYSRSVVGMGVYFDLGYEPFKSYWSYGYSKNDPNNPTTDSNGDTIDGLTFVGKDKVTSVPHLGTVVFDVGIFIVLGLKRI
jgi:hypothetical protein